LRRHIFFGLPSKVNLILGQSGHQAVRAFETEKEVSLQVLFRRFQFPNPVAGSFCNILKTAGITT
jgi:hypothetical protein